MNIPGVEVLSTTLIYGPTVLSIILCILFTLLAMFSIWGSIGRILGDYWELIGIVCILMIFICIGLGQAQRKTILNKQVKTEYVVEITDDAAWKEIGPNYTVINKVYESKEIYVIIKEKIDDYS